VSSSPTGTIIRNGKPTARWGRKAKGLLTADSQAAEVIFGILWLSRRYSIDINLQGGIEIHKREIGREFYYISDQNNHNCGIIAWCRLGRFK
jgi:hypothetical protein